MQLLRRPAAAAVAVAVCSVVAWLPALDAGFVSDDFTMLETAGAVESPLWPFARNDLGQSGDAGHFYRPLWVLWTGGTVELFGERPGAFHAGNLLLFAVICLELLLIARRLLAPAGALAAATLFALYPRHGESVAWVSGSTDLLATAIGLGALLCLVSPGSRGRRIAAAAGLTAAAGLAKEAAFLLPLLALVLAHARPWGRDEALGRHGLPAAAAMTGALALLLVPRVIVIGGLGGYSEEPVSVARSALAAVSYVVASVSPSQLELLRHPLLLAIPLALAGAAAVALWRLRREGPAGRPRLLVAAAGLAWFALALIPVLGLPLDLNNSNGERLLMLPSVGLALAAGALVPARLGTRGGAALGAAGLALLLLSLDTARNWVRAGDIAEQVTASALALAPDDGRLVLLSLPDSYRSARVFTNSFDVALRRARGEGADVAGCVRVQVRDVRAGSIRFRRSRGAFIGTTGWAAPFDFPVTGDPVGATPLCSYREVPSPDSAPGLRLTALARPDPSSGETVVAYFDGAGLRPCCP